LAEIEDSNTYPLLPIDSIKICINRSNHTTEPAQLKFAIYVFIIHKLWLWNT